MLLYQQMKSKNYDFFSSHGCASAPYDMRQYTFSSKLISGQRSVCSVVSIIPQVNRIIEHCFKHNAHPCISMYKLQK